jgi:hypothetical protein
VYLTCPGCAITLFDRNPLISPQYCPRCAARHGRIVELVPEPRFRGATPATLGARPDPESQPVEE